jgi:protein SCO1/2
MGRDILGAKRWRIHSLAWLLFPAISSCVPRSPAAEGGTTKRPSAAPVARSDDRSLFAAPWVWNDDNGSDVRFEQWRGTPIVVSMLYASCTTTCPMTIEKLRRAQQTLEQQRSRAVFVLVTLDPLNDTVEHLREYKESRHLPKEWHLVRGNYEQTRALADLLQIHVLEDGHIFHDSRIVVFDAEGRPIGQLRG